LTEFLKQSLITKLSLIKDDIAWLNETKLKSNNEDKENAMRLWAEIFSLPYNVALSMQSKNINNLHFILQSFAQNYRKTWILAKDAKIETNHNLSQIGGTRFQMMTSAINGMNTLLTDQEILTSIKELSDNLVCPTHFRLRTTKTKMHFFDKIGHLLATPALEALLKDKQKLNTIKTKDYDNYLTLMADSLSKIQKYLNSLTVKIEFFFFIFFNIFFDETTDGEKIHLQLQKILQILFLIKIAQKENQSLNFVIP